MSGASYDQLGAFLHLLLHELQVEMLDPKNDHVVNEKVTCYGLHSLDSR
jgi:hypothetical protein